MCCCMINMNALGLVVSDKNTFHVFPIKAYLKYVTPLFKDFSQFKNKWIFVKLV